MTDNKTPNVVILGARHGGKVAAFEIEDALGYATDVTMVNKGSVFHFVPPNPRVAVRWHRREAIEAGQEPVVRRRDLRLLWRGCSRVRPADSQIDLGDGGVAFLRPAPDPAAQRQLCGQRQMGPSGQGRFRGIFHRQGQTRRERPLPRAPDPRSDRGSPPQGLTPSLTPTGARS